MQPVERVRAAVDELIRAPDAGRLGAARRRLDCAIDDLESEDLGLLTNEELLEQILSLLGDASILKGLARSKIRAAAFKASVDAHGREKESS